MGKSETISFPFSSFLILRHLAFLLCAFRSEDEALLNFDWFCHHFLQLQIPHDLKL